MDSLSRGLCRKIYFAASKLSLRLMLLEGVYEAR